MTSRGGAPNFLFFMTDQHRPDHTGFGGNRVLATPHLDALAARSLRFHQAYVANPICMPNRASILTGRLPSVHGTRHNGIALDWHANTFVRSLRRAGHRTALVGKAHFQNMGMPAPPAWRDERDAAIARPLPPDWDLWEDASRHRRERVTLPPDYYGFDDVELVTGHADLASGHYAQWLAEHGVDLAAPRGPHGSSEVYAAWPQVYRASLPVELYPTRFVTERAKLRLRSYAADAAPFFLQVSYPDPHHPFAPPGKYYDAYDPADVAISDTFARRDPTSMPHVRALLARPGRQLFPVAPFAPTEQQLRHAIAAEYGMIKLLDEGIGELLDELERLGLASDTIVVFTSDHGDMMGDHGLLLKGGLHYEGCTRVPLTVSIPGREGADRHALVSSLDLAPTILELAGCALHRGMQGRSLMPLLDSPDVRLRDALLIEEDEPWDLLGVGRPLRMRTLLDERFRLTLYEGLETHELYDRRDDPNETRNRWADPGAAALRSEAVERIALALADAADRAPAATRFSA
jgi:arylsulfatase A-like enzyme